MVWNQSRQDKTVKKKKKKPPGQWIAFWLFLALPLWPSITMAKMQKGPQEALGSSPCSKAQQ